MKILIILTIIASILRGVRCCENDVFAKLKFVNDPCKDDSECYKGYDKASVACKNGKCSCNDGYVAELQWFTPNDQRSVCVTAPYQGQSCSTACQKPFTCANSDPSKPDVKTCLCRPPAIDKNGVCILECKADEIFQNGECRKRCDNGEIQYDGKPCKKVSKLGEPCSEKDQCSTPFSLCLEGVCSCAPGFTPNSKKDACQSTALWCPFGNPVSSGSQAGGQAAVVQCKVVKRKTSSGNLIPVLYQQLEDNCAEGQFCLLTSGEGYYAEGAVGHCCVAPKLKCPLGLPHPNASCGSSIPDRTKSNLPIAPQCPYDSHSCISFSLGGGFQTSLCCPKACGNNQILFDGKCYPRRNHGDKCEVSDQCKGHNGICEKGVCLCDDDFFTEGSDNYKYCRKICKADEFPYSNDRCLPRLKLGDACDQQLYGQCPVGAQCSEKRVCDCFCGYVKLDDNTCAPQPVCPRTEAPTTQDFFGGILKVPTQDSFGGIVKSTEIKLCRIADTPKSTPLSVVDSCPKGQYCTGYIAKYGLCCPMPDKPFCANGAKPGATCDPNLPNPCGPTANCNRYIIPANNDSTTGYVCCPLFAQVPVPTPLPAAKP